MFIVNILRNLYCDTNKIYNFTIFIAYVPFGLWIGCSDLHYDLSSEAPLTDTYQDVGRKYMKNFCKIKYQSLWLGAKFMYFLGKNHLKVFRRKAIKAIFEMREVIEFKDFRIMLTLYKRIVYYFCNLSNDNPEFLFSFVFCVISLQLLNSNENYVRICKIAK